MKLQEILKAEYANRGDLEDVGFICEEDIGFIYDDDIYVSKTTHIDQLNKLIKIKQHVKKRKYYQSKTDTVYEDIAIVSKDIIQKFKKYMNNDSVSRRIKPEYIYNFNELCEVIDTLTKLNGKHKVWFKPIEGMNGWEVNFEEIL